MKKVISKIVRDLNGHKPQATDQKQKRVCNYQDNYYGDQVCRLSQTNA